MIEGLIKTILLTQHYTLVASMIDVNSLFKRRFRNVSAVLSLKLVGRWFKLFDLRLFNVQKLLIVLFLYCVETFIPFAFIPKRMKYLARLQWNFRTVGNYQRFFLTLIWRTNLTLYHKVKIFWVLSSVTADKCKLLAFGGVLVLGEGRVRYAYVFLLGVAGVWISIAPLWPETLKRSDWRFFQCFFTNDEFLA